MKTCQTCHYWKKQDGDGGRIEPLPIQYADGSDYEARKEARNVDVGLCYAAVFAPDVQYDDPVPPLMVQDGSDYRASLFTRRDFGCVLHEEAPDA